MHVAAVRVSRLLAALLAVVAAATLLTACGTAVPTQPVTPAGVASGAGAADLGVPDEATSDLPTVTPDALPPEALVTLALIRDGGPYPYPKDGVTFQNRERILPRQTSGFYQEYTVQTPGSSDRGARRIVTGKDGSRFYTDDHYGSFREVVAGSAP